MRINVTSQSNDLKTKKVMPIFLVKKVFSQNKGGNAGSNQSFQEVLEESVKKLQKKK